MKNRLNFIKFTHCFGYNGVYLYSYTVKCVTTDCYAETRRTVMKDDHATLKFTKLPKKTVDLAPPLLTSRKCSQIMCSNLQLNARWVKHTTILHTLTSLSLISTLQPSAILRNFIADWTIVPAF